MKRNVVLIVASVLSLLFMIVHLTQVREVLDGHA